MSTHVWKTLDGSSYGPYSYNYTYGMDVVLSKKVRATGLQVQIYQYHSGAAIKAKIYKVDGTLLAASNAVTLSASGWVTFSFTSYVELLASTAYRICFYFSYSTTTNNNNMYYGSYTAPANVDGVTMSLLSNASGNLVYKGSGDIYPQTDLGLGFPLGFPIALVADSIEPNGPSGLSPAGTSATPSILSTLTPTLSWTFSDNDTDGSQGAFEVVIRNAVTNAVVHDSGKVSSSNKSYTVPTGILSAGTIYYWTVDIWDNAGLKNSISPTAQYFRTKSNPTISGNANEDLGNKNAPFAITYSVNDADSSDVLNVVEKLNGSQINTISNAPRNTNFTINITQAILNSLPLNQQNTVQISVTDGYSTTYKTITFTRVNSGPSITNSDKDLGQVAREGIAEKYICHDVEGNVFTIVEKVDDIELKNITGVDGTEYTINIPLNIWLALKNGVHTYTITATDSLGASTTRTFTFTKKETVIESTGLTNIIPTDIAATKILLTPNWLGKENADIILFQVCNNAYDVSPTWEDATSQTLLNKPYTFTNKVKTATKWGIDIKFKISLKAGATEGIEFYGIGGSLE